METEPFSAAAALLPEAPAGASPRVYIPAQTFEACRRGIGCFMQTIGKADPDTLANDHLDPHKSVRRAQILERYAVLRRARLLEIGSGFGTNLAVWIRSFEVDGYGVEPDGEGFPDSLEASRVLFAANDLDPRRLISGFGEALPFRDGAFDIVYSANVLEHTQDPESVIREGLRVLRPGGVMHMELPNFLSFFEGHYLIAQPPSIFRHLLPIWVRLRGRDPAYARTLDTRINPFWCRGAIRRLSKRYPCELIALGEREFRDRLSQPFVFDMRVVESRLSRTVERIQRANWGNWIAEFFIAIQAHYPIYLTVRRR